TPEFRRIVISHRPGGTTMVNSPSRFGNLIDDAYEPCEHSVIVPTSPVCCSAAAGAAPASTAPAMTVPIAATAHLVAFLDIKAPITRTEHVRAGIGKIRAARSRAASKERFSAAWARLIPLKARKDKKVTGRLRHAGRSSFRPRPRPARPPG